MPAASGLLALATSPATQVEDHRLADIRAADDGYNQQRRQVDFGQKLMTQQLDHFLAGRRSNAQHTGALGSMAKIARSARAPAGQSPGSRSP